MFKPVNYTFPRTNFVDNSLFDQLEHVKSELDETIQAYLHEPIERAAEELVDLYHSVETALRIIDERYVPIKVIIAQVEKKNRERGYYRD